MGYAYTPGLTVAANTVVRKVRRLPLKGTVLAKAGQRVSSDEVVAETSLPGDVKPINVAGKLGIAPGELSEIMLKRAGLLANVNGATQIRAGVIRPEVIIPVDEEPAGAGSGAEEGGVLEIGTALRAIRNPHFGRIGRCTGLPVELERLPSETRARVVEVEFEDGERATLPRANVELIRQ